MLGAVADRVDRGLLARDQLAAAARGHRRGDRQGQEAGEHRAEVVVAGRSARPAPSTSSGPTAAARVTPSRTRTATPVGARAAYGRGAEAEQVPQVGDGVDPAGETRLSRGARGRHRRRPPRSARRRPSRRPGRRRAAPRAVLQACMARSRRWVETSTQAPRARASSMTARVASTPSGSTPSKGSSSSSTSGSWRAARTTESRRPMPWLKPLVTRCATSPSSKRSSRSRARASQSSRRRRRAASWRCSHGVARGTRPPTSGQ